MIKSKYLISVVIPCYNCENVISRAVESVFDQTYPNWELILVDNNSTDNTANVLKEFEKKYPEKVRVFEEKTKGAPAARNKGLNNSQGNWVQFLDADDKIDKLKFERHIELIDQYNSDVILANYQRVVKFMGFEINKAKMPIVSNVWVALIKGRCGITSANLYKKERVEQIGGWTEGLTSSQETDLLFRLLTIGSKVIFDESISASVYFESNSISRNVDNKKNLNLLNNYLGLRLRVKDYLISKNKYNEHLETAVDESIYSYLLDKKSQLPDVVEKHLSERNFRIKRGKQFSMFLRSKLKKIIN